MSRWLFPLVALVLSGCAASKWYQLPLNPYEGEAMIPALIATSQELGLKSFRANGAFTTLEDGTELSWQSSAAGDQFILLVNLPSGVAEKDQEARFAAAKTRAEEIWKKAAGARTRALTGE